MIDLICLRNVFFEAKEKIWPKVLEENGFNQEDISVDYGYVTNNMEAYMNSQEFRKMVLSNILESFVYCDVGSYNVYLMSTDSAIRLEEIKKSVEEVLNSYASQYERSLRFACQVFKDYKTFINNSTIAMLKESKLEVSVGIFELYFALLDYYKINNDMVHKSCINSALYVLSIVSNFNLKQLKFKEYTITDIYNAFVKNFVPEEKADFYNLAVEKLEVYIQQFI